MSLFCHFTENVLRAEIDQTVVLVKEAEVDLDVGEVAEEGVNVAAEEVGPLVGDLERCVERENLTDTVAVTERK